MAGKPLPILRLIRGDSSPRFEISVADVAILDTDWTCRLCVTELLESGDYIVSRMLDKNLLSTAFDGQILPDESVFLIGKKYFLVFEIENLIKYLRREVQYELLILDSGIKNDGTYVRMLGKSVDAAFSLGSLELTGDANTVETSVFSNFYLGDITVSVI